MINKMIAHILPYMPEGFVWLFSRRYISGKKPEDAIRVVRELNQNKILATIDVLGEEINAYDQALSYRDQYLNVIRKVTDAKLLSTFSVKPTMFGLLFDEKFCYNCIRDIVIAAREGGYMVRLDMEDSRCTTKEIELYKALYGEYPENIGIVVQACLKRTISDLAYIHEFTGKGIRANIRLCKGIYNEPAEISYKGRQEIRNNFLLCLEYMAEQNMYAAIATHDKLLIEKSSDILKLYNKTNQDFEFQMLLGVAPRLRSKIAGTGYTMRVYVPFGDQWFRYATRRLQENPNMVFNIISGIFIRK